MPVTYIPTLVNDNAHDEEIWSVAWSKKANVIVSGSLDASVKCWDASTGEFKYELKEHALGVMSVDTHGSRAVTASLDAIIAIWDLENNGTLVKKIVGDPGQTWSARFSPDGESIATGSHSGNIHIYNIETGEKTTTFSAKGFIMSIAYSPDGQFLAAGADDGGIYVYNTETGQLAHTFSDHTMAVRSLTFASDNRTLISGCDDKCIHVYDVEHGQLASILTGHTSWILSVAANPDISKQQLASGSADGKVKVWDLGMRSVIETHEGDEGEVWNVAWNSEGTKLVSVSSDKTIRWYASSGSS
ncbi:wd repeat-containing protein 61 [Lichtheimia corymbifera JMRC:FSU:9682]|uniref:Wd repeat-containing protein 61 n=2 Tax=Lichtheimia TaxID=688353 RepID=A0A068RFN3_9FUNG|nr:uncharacterized protein O0I10_006384 [Lichtheimia ornata]KAJ8657856.1 hypothetical protein O0I10_006384 [Lichtheimia ornata]CDH48442.1 wd repeat-containing protein 61 [Lichtheimia corymbifera JMRC:FSU:9682]